MVIKKVGVVGLGIMGSGIAQSCAQSKYQVIVTDVDNGRITKGLSSIDAFLTKSIEKGKITSQEKDAALGRIKGAANIKELSDCDIVVEAVFEDMDLKKKTFAELDKVCSRDTILATNTSA